MESTDYGPLLTALWLGILTSVHPCTLAPNLTAISFVSRKSNALGAVLLAGGLYTAGRVVTYVGLCWLLVSSFFAVQTVTLFLQVWLNQLLGPLFVIGGVLLLELLPWRFRFRPAGLLLRRGFSKSAETWGAFGLGMLLALALCPPTAALLMLVVGLAVKGESTGLLPACYGIGTGLPVLFCAVALSLGARTAANAVGRLQAAEKYLRTLSAVGILATGIWLTLRYNFLLF